ncbi:DUF2156 domain-containing protein [Romboutsia sp.]|uniref:DUF2156 domain-containing protein n=1 Tax=Romboutsia sp. TaxID=1965302 RepID=UPI002C51203C|nr:phosphatidylglycerol lysyltransferase domain-containing protein [Romboutsia sp.]HSQ89806.1 phosphatidylglycerol lysyltransferase domain-containing protein [Romboutsia sp.]
MLSIDDFKPLDLEDKPLFDRYYKKFPPFHSDQLFTTMISWNDYAHYHYTLIKNHLIIMTIINNQVQFRNPMGRHDREICYQVLKLAKNVESNYSLGFIDHTSKVYLTKNFPKLEFIPQRGYFDYVYLSSELAKLEGEKFRKIRNRLNKFKKKNIYTTEDISKENMEEVRKFLKRWCLWRDCESDKILKNEKKAIIYSMKHFFDLDLSGLVLRVNEKIEAISVYEKMDEETVVIHYEKGSPYYDGIYKAINQEVAERVCTKYRYINRESDMDAPGLRQAKMSYRPHHLVKVFAVNKKNIQF